MKTYQDDVANTGACAASGPIRLATCRGLATQIESSKNAIFAEFSEANPGQERILHLALNEAEALAWQTEYPHLVFPTLATEKAEALAAWQARARAVRATPFMLSLAA